MPKGTEVQVRLKMIPTIKAMAYLGVRLNTKPTCCEQIKFVSHNAVKVTRFFRRFMGNILVVEQQSNDDSLF